MTAKIKRLKFKFLTFKFQVLKTQPQEQKNPYKGNKLINADRQYRNPKEKNQLKPFAYQANHFRTN